MTDEPTKLTSQPTRSPDGVVTEANDDDQPSDFLHSYKLSRQTLPDSIKKSIRAFRRPLKATRTSRLRAMFGIPATPFPRSVTEEEYIYHAKKECKAIKNVLTSETLKIPLRDRDTLRNRMYNLNRIVKKAQGHPVEEMAHNGHPRMGSPDYVPLVVRYPVPCRESSEIINEKVRRHINNCVKRRILMLPEVPDHPLKDEEVFPLIGFRDATEFINHVESQFPHPGITWADWGVSWTWYRPRMSKGIYYNQTTSPEFRRAWNPNRIRVKLKTGFYPSRPILYTSKVTLAPPGPPEPRPEKEVKALYDRTQQYVGSEYDPMPGPITPAIPNRPD